MIEECPVTYDTLTNEVVKELLEKVMEFCGFLFVRFCGGELCFLLVFFFFFKLLFGFFSRVHVSSWGLANNRFVQVYFSFEF